MGEVKLFPSDIELLDGAVKRLDNVHIPLKDIPAIGIPVFNAFIDLKRLQQVIESYSEADKKQEEPEDERDSESVSEAE